MTASIDPAGSTKAANPLDRLLLGFFVLASAAVLGLWAGYFSDGTAATALFEPIEESGMLLGRTLGAAMACLVLAMAAFGLRSDRPRARSLTLFGSGMVGYAALNTLGETLPSGSVGSALLVAALGSALVIGLWSDDCRLPAVLSVLLAGCAAWLVGRAIHVGGGSLTNPVSLTTWPGPHYVAEATMALVTMGGLLARCCGRAWGTRAALIGLGTYCYSALNAMDWAYVNDRTVLPILVVTLAAAIAGAVHLTATKENHDAHRHRSIGIGRPPDGVRRDPVRR